MSAFWQRRDAGFSIPKGFERGIRIIPRNMQYSFSWYVGKMDSAIFDLKAGIIHVHQDPLSPLNENHCAIPSERLDMPTCKKLHQRRRLIIPRRNRNVSFILIFQISGCEYSGRHMIHIKRLLCWCLLRERNWKCRQFPFEEVETCQLVEDPFDIILAR